MCCVPQKKNEKRKKPWKTERQVSPSFHFFNYSVRKK